MASATEICSQATDNCFILCINIQICFRNVTPNNDNQNKFKVVNSHTKNKEMYIELEDYYQTD